MSKTRIIIARHGNNFTADQTPTRVGKNTDLPLVEAGFEKGRLMGRYFKEKDMIPDLIFASKLQRTSQTANAAQEVMGTSLEIDHLEIFDEIDYGPDENQTEDVVIARIGQEAIDKWNAETIVPDGWNVDPDAIIQNWKDFAARMLKEHEGKTVLVVTSNGIARFAPHLTGDFDSFAKEHKIKIPPGAVCIFEHEDEDGENWKCAEWNFKPVKYYAET